MTLTDDEYFMNEAIREARKSLFTGGIPIGSVLVMDGKIIGRGYNRRVQYDSCILHAEMDCLENVGRLTRKEYSKCTIYSTLSPCEMCSGAIMLYRIPRIVIGENETYEGPEIDCFHSNLDYDFNNMNLQECKDMMKEFIKKNPELWKEDIGE